MKKVLLSFLLLFAATAMNAQTIVKGDMDGDGEVTITDVTSAVDVILGKAPGARLQATMAERPTSVRVTTIGAMAQGLS